MYHRGNPIDYLGHYYSKANYQPVIYHVPSEGQWPRSNQPIIEPLKTMVAPGRPRKVRIRWVKEPKNPNTIRQEGNKN
jgi:hypothetical protein